MCRIKGAEQFADALQALVRALGTTGVDRGDVIGAILPGGVQAFNQRDYSSSCFSRPTYGFAVLRTSWSAGRFNTSITLRPAVS